MMRSLTSSVPLLLLWARFACVVGEMSPIQPIAPIQSPVSIHDMLQSPSITPPLPAPPTSPRPSAAPTESPTDSPAPSPSPSEAPTETPTESPAPSPSPSEAPTQIPTGTPAPTGNPTAEPTESPAPSPSPSEAPTQYPTGSPSATPSGNPTVSPRPTTSPSEKPSDAPSTAPSKAPTSQPSASLEPSGTPTASPSEKPSGAPSLAPSGAPSVSMKPTSAPSESPTKTPTKSPSAQPTGVPSVSPTTSEPSRNPSSAPTKVPTTEAPSAAPSPSPTAQSFRTKTTVTNVLLVGVENDMEGEVVGKFEIATLKFILDTKPPTTGFDIDILAVTVLTQTHVNLEDENVVIDAHGARRQLDDSATPAVQVAFRTVGMVTDGTMTGTTFKDIVEDGFKNHFNQYLFQLSQKDEFFSVLDTSASELEVQGTPMKEKSKGQFIVTILFSSVAFVLALFASHYAIKKHLRTQKRITDRGMMLEYPGFTHDTSGSSDEGDNIGKAPTLQLDIDDDKIEMEDIGLTPTGVPKPVESPFGEHDERRPLSPSQMEEGMGRTSLGAMSEASSGLKKWLTPRQGLFSWMNSTPKNDPPGSGRPSKVSTTTDLGVRRETIDGNSQIGTGTKEKPQRKSRGDGRSPYTIPMSFFSGDGDDGSDGTGTPMASLAGSTASSFFNRMGRSVFTGRKSGMSEASRASRGPVQLNMELDQKPDAPQYEYNFGTADGGNSEIEVEVTKFGSQLNAANLAMHQHKTEVSTMQDKMSRFEQAQRPPTHTMAKQPPIPPAGSQEKRKCRLKIKKSLERCRNKQMYLE